MSVINAVSDFFLGDPFNTKVGSLIEESTEDFVGAELWQMFNRVCNAINHDVNGPRDAVRAIRRRLVNSAGTNETVAMHTLLLLETCVLNCGYRFHLSLATKDNLRDLIKLATSETNGVPLNVREKLLTLIQTWASHFGKHVDLQEFVSAYNELKARGIHFPATVQEQSDQRSQVMHASINGVPSDSSDSTSVCSAEGQQTARESTQQLRFDATQRNSKLNADLAQVRVNICVLSDLITEAETAETPNADARQLMEEIVSALKEMSERVIQAISRWEAYRERFPSPERCDSVLLDMLNVNDELQTVLLRYSRTIRLENANKDQIVEHTTNGPSEMLGSDLNGTAAEFRSFVGECPPCSTSGVSVSDTRDDDEVALLAPGAEPTSASSTKEDRLIDL